MNGVVKERPILFNGAMVSAILSGAKTQTRRVATPKRSIEPMSDECPFGQPGDRLWVRESFWGCDLPGYGDQPCVVYDDEWQGTDYRPAEARPWARKFGRIPAIHMPRDACRLVLEITAVRVERLQAISEADAIAEGAPAKVNPSELRWQHYVPHALGFIDLWNSTGGDWDSNPWVWVIEFKRVEA